MAEVVGHARHSPAEHHLPDAQNVPSSAGCAVEMVEPPLPHHRMRQIDCQFQGLVRICHLWKIQEWKFSTHIRRLAKRNLLLVVATPKEGALLVGSEPAK